MELAEKNPDLTTKELAGNFAAKFCRPKQANTILQILRRKKEIRHEFASWAANFAIELNEAANYNQANPGPGRGIPGTLVPDADLCNQG